jgi:hypothetical protein
MGIRVMFLWLLQEILLYELSEVFVETYFLLILSHYALVDAFESLVFQV